MNRSQKPRPLEISEPKKKTMGQGESCGCMEWCADAQDDDEDAPPPPVSPTKTSYRPGDVRPNEAPGAYADSERRASGREGRRVRAEMKRGSAEATGREMGREG